MKNTVIISCVFPPEPVVSAQISFALANKLATVTTVNVLSPKPSRPLGYQLAEYIHVRNSKMNNLKFITLDSFVFPRNGFIGRTIESISWGFSCKKYIKANKDDISKIYLNSWPFFSQYIIINVARKLSIPVYTHIQDIYPESFINKLPLLFQHFALAFLKPIDIFILNNSKKIFVISNSMKSYLSRTREIDENKFEVITNWQTNVPTSFYEKSEEPVLTFMYLGNIGPAAGVEFLIKAFSFCSNNARLIIAGSGSNKDICNDLAVELGNNKIEFLSVPNGEVYNIQQRADILILSTKKGVAHSSIPSKLVAYMFSGRPVLAMVESNSESEKCILESKCGWVIEPESIDTFKSTLSDILTTTNSSLNSLGKNAFEYANLHFSEAKNLNKIFNMLNETE